MLCSICHLLNGNGEAAPAEPSLSRKKKCPGQPIRDHPLYDKDEGESSDSLDIGLTSQDQDSRARIPDEETKVPSRAAEDGDVRKAEEKQPLMSQSYPPSTNPRGNPGTPGPPEEGGVPKTTEYRSQFVAYPRPPGESYGSTARKSASMGLIAPQFIKKDTVDGEAPVGELWSSVNDEDDDDAALDAVKRGRIKKTEYKAKFRPFSAYTYVDGSWKKATRLIKDNESALEADRHAWYSEVVERLKKADQYRARSHTGGSLYGSENLPQDFFMRDRTVLSPMSVVASASRTWKDDRPAKERARPAPVPVHHRKEKKDATDSLDHPKSREGSTKKKPHVEKAIVRPKSAEPVIPVAKSEHKSPKRTRPRAPKDLPVHGHGDLSGRKKAYKQSADKGSPVGAKPRAVLRPQAAGDEGKVWLKPDVSKEKEGEKEGGALVNGFASEESDDHSVQPKMPDDAHINGEHVVPLTKPPLKVPLTTVKSPEEVTGVRSPDPESWTVPLEIGKGLHWMDGKTPDGVQAKGPPILLSKRLKESSLVGKSQKDIVLCDPGSESTGESVDL